MMGIYGLLYFLCKLVLLIAYPLLSDGMKKWISLRRKPMPDLSQYHSALVFHAASGEIEYCKSLIRHFRKSQPHLKIVVTYTSPSAERLFENIKPYVDLFLPLPWDEPDTVDRFLTQLKPRTFVFSRTDFWPELIQQLDERGIPMGVVAFNPSRSKGSQFIYKQILPHFRFASCVDRESVNFINQLEIPVFATADGDTRFDQVFYRLEQSPNVEISSDKPLIVLGSTWPADEEIVLPAFPSLIKAGYRIVICPHENNETSLRNLFGKLNDFKFSSKKLTDSPSDDRFYQFELNADVTVIDRTGILADLYRFAAVAYVGGAAHHRVHSVMEPLCAGLHVIHGKHYENSPEAVRYQRLYTHAVETSQEFFDLCTKLNKDLDRPTILKAMSENRNATQKVYDIILNSLQGTAGFGYRTN